MWVDIKGMLGMRQARSSMRWWHKVQALRDDERTVMLRLTTLGAASITGISGKAGSMEQPDGETEILTAKSRSSPPSGPHCTASLVTFVLHTNPSRSQVRFQAQFRFESVTRMSTEDFQDVVVSKVLAV